MCLTVVLLNCFKLLTCVKLVVNLWLRIITSLAFANDTSLERHHYQYVNIYSHQYYNNIIRVKMNSSMKVGIYLAVWFIVTTGFNKTMAQNISTQLEHQTLTHILNFLKFKNDFDFSSIILVTDEERSSNANSIRNEAFNYLHSDKNNFQFVIIPLSYNSEISNMSYHFKASLDTGKPSLIIIDEPKLIIPFKKLVGHHGMSVDMIKNNCWLLIDCGNGANDSISIQELVSSVMNKGIDVSSRIFYVRETDLSADLYEMYRKCPESHIDNVYITTFGKLESRKQRYMDFIWNRRQNLGGCKLRIAYIVDYPFIDEVKEIDPQLHDPSSCLNEGGKIMCGHYIALFKNFVENSNFAIEWVLANETKYGSYDETKKKWLGVVGVLNQNKAEFSPLQFTVTNSRSNAVQFSPTLTNLEARMYMKRPSYGGSWQTYIEVLDFHYWICLCVSVFVLSVSCSLHYNIYKHMQQPREIEDWHTTSVASAFSLVFISFTSQEIKGISRFAPTSFKILFFTICVFGMVNYFIYSGRLISTLLTKETELPINYLRDILDHPDYQLAVQDGSSKEGYFRYATSEPQKTLWDEHMDGREKARVKSAELDDTLMNDEKRIVFISSYYAEMYLPNYPCNIIKLKGIYLRGSTNALAFRPNSPYYRLFSHVLAKIKNYGEWDHIKTRKDENRNTVSCLNNEGVDMSLGYGNTFTMFVVFGMGLAVSLVLIIGEWVCKYVLNICKKERGGSVEDKNVKSTE